MITGRFNIVLGLVAMILAAITGFALGIQALFHTVQFVLAGSIIGLAYGRLDTHGV